MHIAIRTGGLCGGRFRWGEFRTRPYNGNLRMPGNCPNPRQRILMPIDNSQNRFHRRSIRMKGYDYSQPGAYFITICTHQNQSFFGKIVDGEMQLNDLGKVVQFTWDDLVNHVDNIELGPFVIMPNHVHGIIQITAPDVGAGLDKEGSVRAGSEPAPTTSSSHTPLSEIVRQFKTFSARRVNNLRKSTGDPVWQRNYYEHIIRNNESFQKIGDYILTNPIQWENDRYYPGGTP